METVVIALAIVVGIAYHVLINRTRIGFDLRATGSNPISQNRVHCPVSEPETRRAPRLALIFQIKPSGMASICVACMSM